MEFEWDTAKARSNFRKHRVSFEEAKTVFYDVLAATMADPDHSLDETRQLIVGLSTRNRLLIVSFAERFDKCRIISARELTKTERSDYEKAE